MISGIGKILTSNSLNNITSNTNSQVMLETTLKSIGRPGFILIDNEINEDTKRYAAAKEFLNWMVYSEIGQQMLVKTCNLIPPFQNNPYEPSDPLSRDIYEKVREGKAFNASAIVPNDHWSVLGAAMQKYLANRSDREELIQSIEAYWAEQN